MKHSPACADLVKRSEDEAGFIAGRCSRLKAYLCPAGIWTIGWGHTGGVKPGAVWTEEQADQALEQDLAAFEGAVSAAVHTELTQGQFDALVSFAYNCKGWRTSTLFALVNAGKFAAAAGEFPKWVHAGEKMLPGLVKRRAAERELFVG
jgi:lysozyme